MASGALSLVGWSPTSRTHPALMRWGYGWGRIDDPQDRLSCSFKYLAGHFESLPFHQFAAARADEVEGVSPKIRGKQPLCGERIDAYPVRWSVPRTGTLRAQ